MGCLQGGVRAETNHVQRPGENATGHTHLSAPRATRSCSFASHPAPKTRHTSASCTVHMTQGLWLGVMAASCSNLWSHLTWSDCLVLGKPRVHSSRPSMPPMLRTHTHIDSPARTCPRASRASTWMRVRRSLSAEHFSALASADNFLAFSTTASPSPTSSSSLISSCSKCGRTRASTPQASSEPTLFGRPCAQPCWGQRTYFDLHILESRGRPGQGGTGGWDLIQERYFFAHRVHLLQTLTPLFLPPQVQVKLKFLFLKC